MAMDLIADIVAAPPTSMAPFAGAPAIRADSILGKTQTLPGGFSLLKDQQTSIRELEEAANRLDRPMLAALFLRTVFETPTRPAPVRTTGSRERGPGHDGELGYWELRALALEWDRLGLTTPLEFVRAVSCEVRGHRRYRAIQETLNEGPLLD